ncbi:ankyrin repeat domain-containing protein [Candidatus Babeliales bacterium]|nr:ankyrin repeat domain-containing protein [Candidatus Babeliales bacterium]
MSLSAVLMTLALFSGSAYLSGAASKVDGEKLLSAAVRAGNVERAEIFLQQGADVNTLFYVEHCCYTPLVYSVLRKNKDMIALLLKYGAIIPEGLLSSVEITEEIKTLLMAVVTAEKIEEQRELQIQKLRRDLLRIFGLRLLTKKRPISRGNLFQEDEY